tara:strand:- start:112 stop:630 length:519 start_codon:yes stop_codon:yes gene_type:complete
MDKILFFNTLFGFMTLISWLISISIFYLYLTKRTFNKLITEQFLNYAISVASFCAIGSLIYSEIVGFIPCKYCWYQRYLMYPIALVLLASFFKKALFKFGYISLIGFFLSIYHIYLQNGGGNGGSCALDVPCSSRYVDIFGFISIPVMAGSGFLTIFVAILYYDYARKQISE